MFSIQQIFPTQKYIDKTVNSFLTNPKTLNNIPEKPKWRLNEDISETGDTGDTVIGGEFKHSPIKP